MSLTKEEAKKLLKRKKSLELNLEVARNKLAWIDGFMPNETAAQLRAKDRRMSRLLRRMDRMRVDIESIDALDIFE